MQIIQMLLLTELSIQELLKKRERIVTNTSSKICSVQSCKYASWNGFMRLFTQLLTAIFLFDTLICQNRKEHVAGGPLTRLKQKMVEALERNFI